MRGTRRQATLVVIIVALVFLLISTFLVRETCIWSDAQFAWQSYQNERRYSQAFLLCEEGATATDLAAVLGTASDTDENTERGEIVWWRYDGPKLDGNPVNDVVVAIEKRTSRIVWVSEGYIFSLREPLTMARVDRIKRMYWFLVKVLGDPHKAAEKERGRRPIVNPGCKPVVPVPCPPQKMK